MKISGLLLLVSVPLLWVALEYTNTSGWRLIADAKSEIMEAKEPSRRTDGRLLHVVGPLALKDDLVYDSDLMIVFKGARVRRSVEMYQWQKKSSAGVDNYYSVWSHSAISSSNHSYAYPNPTWDSRVSAKTILNESRASVNGFHIPSSLLNSLSDSATSASPHSLQLPHFLDSVSLVVYIDANYIYLTPRARPTTEAYYPYVGDYRLTYYVDPVNSIVAVIGEQRNDALALWREQILLLSDTILDSDALLETLSVSFYLLMFLRSLFVVLIVTGAWLADIGGPKKLVW
jgi:hypothetical protein